MAQPRRVTRVQVSQDAVTSDVQVRHHTDKVVSINVEDELSLPHAVATRLEEVSVLCLQLESGEALSAFLAAMGRCKALWSAYVEEEGYKREALRAERLLEGDESEEG